MPIHEFQIEIDDFGGVIIDQASLPNDTGDFEHSLKQALIEWKCQNLKLVWLRLPIEKSDLIPIAVKLGFSFHHCRGDYIMLTGGLQEDAFIPPYASHFIGVGGVVLSEQKELLVVLEKYNGKKSPHNYKLPGGLVEVGEAVSEGVVREVFEETGVKTRFESLVGFTHQAVWRFEKSAFYLVCRLYPLTKNIIIDEKEIAEAFWIPVDQYLAHPEVQAFNKRIVEHSLNGGKLKLSNSTSSQKNKVVLEEFF